MVYLRVGSREERFPDGQWEAWVSEGRVPPDALVFSLQFTDGLWKRADELPLYDFFRRSGEEDRREARLGVPGATPFADLPAVALPKRGLSGTETLLGINLLVGLVLVLIWRADYAQEIYELATRFHRWFVESGNPVGFVATLFMHANVGHILANMVTLAVSAAFVEYFFGRRVYLIYLVSGVVGAAASFVIKSSPPMSVGASGAVYGLIAALAAFVIRYYPRLPRWHRWKARRIYVPILMVVVLPAIFHADWRAHVGGFLGGFVLGLLLSPAARGRRLLLGQGGGEDRS